MNLKTLPYPKYKFSCTLKLPRSSYFKIISMHGSTLLLSGYFYLYYDTDSSEQCVWGFYYDLSPPPPIYRRGNWGLDLLRSCSQELADMRLILRFFSTKTNVSPSETGSFTKCLEPFVYKWGETKKRMRSQLEQDAEMLISSWLTILGLWFPTSFATKD